MKTTFLAWASVVALWLAPAATLSQTAETPKQTTPSAMQTKPGMTASAISKADQDKLITLERGAWEIVKKKDWKAFDTTLTPNFVWIDDGGIFVGRAEAVKRFSNFDLTGYTIQDIKVTAFAPDNALVSYQVTQQGSFAGQPIPDKPFYIGSGYVKRGAKWLNSFTQSTLAH